MKLATYAPLPVKCLQWAPITACTYYTCFFATIVCFSLSFAYRFPDVASLVDFLYCLVCLREILLDKKIKTWPKVTAPGLKFRVVSRPPWPRLAARLAGNGIDWCWNPLALYMLHMDVHVCISIKYKLTLSIMSLHWYKCYILSCYVLPLVT